MTVSERFLLQFDTVDTIHSHLFYILQIYYNFLMYVAALLIIKVMLTMLKVKVKPQGAAKWFHW